MALSNVHFTDLGFHNTKIMFSQAVEGGFAIPAYNFNNMEQLQAIIDACVQSQSPAILQVSRGARSYANEILLQYMSHGAIEYMKHLSEKYGKGEVPIALHLDHGDSFETAKACIDRGFSSVMIDASMFPFEENIRITKEVVAYAHDRNVSVEAELGVLESVDTAESADVSPYTNPDDVEDFVSQTNVDSLAIAIGTCHGAFKFHVKPGQPLSPLRFDILEEIERRIPGFPIVLHGASSVLQEYVDLVNNFGGNLKETAGVSEEQLRRAAKSAVCKINIDTDGRLIMTGAVRKVLMEKPDEFDPRKYLGPARDALTKMYMHKHEKVLGSASTAPSIMKAINETVLQVSA